MNAVQTIKWASIAGMGPAAWNRDSKVLGMHTLHHHKHDRQINAREMQHVPGSRANK